MKRYLALAVLIPVAVACSDHDAREDLDTNKQTNDRTEAVVGVMPDGWPNPAHKCLDLGRIVVGYWATSDRAATLIYNDHACEGSNPEQPQEVIRLFPRIEQQRMSRYAVVIPFTVDDAKAQGDEAELIHEHVMDLLTQVGLEAVTIGTIEYHRIWPGSDLP